MFLLTLNLKKIEALRTFGFIITLIKLETCFGRGQFLYSDWVTEVPDSCNNNPENEGVCLQKLKPPASPIIYLMSDYHNSMP